MEPGRHAQVLAERAYLLRERPSGRDISFNGDHVLTSEISAVEMQELVLAIDRKLESQNTKIEQ
jgi:hypothetical protein